MSSNGTGTNGSEGAPPGAPPGSPTPTPRPDKADLETFVMGTKVPAASPLGVRLRMQRTHTLTERVTNATAPGAVKKATPQAEFLSPQQRFQKRLAAEAAKQNAAAPDAASGENADDVPDQGEGAGSSNRKADADAAREQLKRQQQAQMDEIFSSRMGGLAEGTDCDAVQEALNLLSVEQLPPTVQRANGKANTVWELAEKIEQRMDDQVDKLKGAAAKGGKHWINTLDNMRARLKTGVGLEPALQSAVILQWLVQARSESVQQTTQDCVRAALRTGPAAIKDLCKLCEQDGYPPATLLKAGTVTDSPGYGWLDPALNDDYATGWSWVLMIVDRALAHMTKDEMAAAASRRDWEVITDSNGSVITHKLQQKQHEKIKDHYARVRRAAEKMEAAHLRDNKMKEYPPDSLHVVSYMNSLRDDIQMEAERLLVEMEAKNDEITMELVTAVAAKAEQNLTTEFSWMSTKTRKGHHQTPRQPERQGETKKKTRKQRYRGIKKRWLQLLQKLLNATRVTVTNRSGQQMKRQPSSASARRT